MDNYPENLAPAFEDGGGVATPFEEWWPRVRHAFPNVPENVARYWLHEHWSHSPFSWIPSANYRFELTDWPAADLPLIRSGWCNFAEDNAECRVHGKHLISRVGNSWKYPTALHMLEHGDFPAPIIVLDNRDGHLVQGIDPVPKYCEIPSSYVLIEGHRRFNLALHLQSVGRLKEYVSVWLMQHD